MLFEIRSAVLYNFVKTSPIFEIQEFDRVEELIAKGICVVCWRVAGVPRGNEQAEPISQISYKVVDRGSVLSSRLARRLRWIGREAISLLLERGVSHDPITTPDSTLDIRVLYTKSQALLVVMK